MFISADTVIALTISLPALYSFSCFLRRMINAKRAADWVRKHHQPQWKNLHWITRRSNWAGVEVLVTKGLISGPEIEAFRNRDESLEKATWGGLFISAALLLLVLIAKTLASLFS